MGWLNRILAPSRDTEASAFANALSAARAKREAAWNAYQAAKIRGDTRSMKEAHRSLRHATTDLVRMELGRV